ncbi:MAG: 2'-5' RNA ligase family protein [Chloroflexota bacterium]
MAFVVELYFDAVAEDSVRRIWKMIADAGISSSMLDGAFRPHVSLGVSNQLNLNEACSAMASFAASVSPFTLTFSNIGVFPTTEGVVFLGATVTQQLLNLHAEFHHVFQKFANDQWDYYRIGKWVPHCTLAFGLPANKIADTVAVCQQAALPIQAQVEEIEVVEIFPASFKTLCLYRLGHRTDDG